MLDSFGLSRTASAILRRRIAYRETLSTLRDIKGVKTENVSLADQERQKVHDATLEQLQNKAATAGTKTAAAELRAEHQAIAAELKEEQIHLQIIRGLMSAVASDPFATVFEKANAQLKLIPLAIATIKADLATQQGNIQGGILDPQQLEQARQKLVQDNLELIKLGQTAKTLSFGGTLRADLVTWANQFGTTAKQIGNAITTTIGTAVSGVSNAITGAIFKTQSWGQAFAQVAQQIVGNIVNAVVQWAAQQVVLLALHAAFGATAAASTAAVAAASAAAWAPAATAASIATEGEADAAGVTALAAAMGTGQGIVTGFSAGGSAGFAEGGFTGGREGRVAGFVHGEEFVFSAQAVRRIGVEPLQNLHLDFSRPSYEAGGFVGSLGSESLGKKGGSGGKPPVIQSRVFFRSARSRQAPDENARRHWPHRRYRPSQQTQNRHPDMSGITITIDASALQGAQEKVENLLGAVTGDQVKKSMGDALRLVLINHFAELEADASRHRTATRLGGTQTGFYADAVRGTQLPQIEGEGISVSINKQGIAQRYFGGTIRPTLKKWLTIPAIAEAYGQAAGSFHNLRFVPLGPDLAALVERRATLIKRPRKGAKKGSFKPVAETTGAVFYWLKRQVTQTADPTVLPTDDEIQSAALERGQQTIITLWERLGVST